MDQCEEPLLEESVSRIEEPLPDPDPEPSTSNDLAKEPSSDPSPIGNEEIQTPGCAPKFGDDLDEDYGNTLNYFSIKRPHIPLTPPDPIELQFLKETVWELTSIMSDEWLRDVELSSEVIQINTAPRTIPCHLEGNNVGILYSTTVGVNIVSESFAFAYLSDKASLDGSDETKFNKTAPTWKIFSSGVGKKRARLSTTHCTQQVIPEEELR
uniref:Uncharacterized protein n=2 Tax=Oryza sativa subsp. japonica TaxID=39947 RepID=Q6UUG5_ORYSJ|nr:hypothetical protein OSJNBa0038J12.4 [Oryza sativa Japonica Group]